MSLTVNTPRRTIVYIDGYNLYYGRLRDTPYKWLDVVELFRSILSRRDQNESLVGVKMFTAPALATFATHGETSVHAQDAYHRALTTLHPACFEIIKGKHTFDKSGSLLPEFVAGQPFDRRQRVRVWKLEEKQTDVNLALTMYRDASKGRYDRAILVSNDSDAEPALKAIRADFPGLMLGVVLPIHPPTPGTTVARRSSGSLIKNADWLISHLTDMQLGAAMLPAHVPTNKKPIRKPLHW